MGILGYQGLTIQHFGDRKTGQNPPHKVISPIQIAGASGISHGFRRAFRNMACTFSLCQAALTTAMMCSSIAGHPSEFVNAGD